MAEQYNQNPSNLLDLSKGLHMDYHPISQPEGTYRYLLNGIRKNSGALENEKGTIDVKVLNKTVIGGVVLDRDLILFLVPSEIGVLDENDVYTTITTRADLNFQLNTSDRHFDVVAKKDFQGHRIVFPVDGINPDRRIDLDDVVQLTSLTFADDTKLQVNPDIPEILVDSVVDGGTLPTGIYQATARLLTSTSNAGPFGLVSPLVPIIDESIGASYDQQDGAIPQTASPKAINFLIQNIDTQYAYIEIAIITYIGTANITSVHSVAVLPIDNRSTIPFTYASVEQNKESIDLAAITVKPISYDYAKSIEQKDGRLVRSNLTAIRESFDFQSLANLVKIKYTIEEIPWQPGYKDPLLSAYKKGYQRGEVYSFSIEPQFTSSYNTTAYHIPGSNISRTANPLTKELGTYVSQEVYPLNKNYPTGYILHHRMPTIEQEPLIVIKGNTPYLRILGIQVDFTDALSLLPADIKKNIYGFTIGRQTRQGSNKSILAQGIANTHFRQSDVGYTFLSPFAKSLFGRTDFYSGSISYFDQIGFMSPETTIYNDLPVGAIHLESVAELRGKQLIVHDLRTHHNDAQEIANTQVFLDYNEAASITSTSVDIITNSPQYIEASSASIAGPNLSNVVITGTNNTINNYKNNGYLYLKLKDNLPMKQDSYNPNTGNGYTNQQPEFFYYYRGSDKTDLIFMNGQEKSDTSVERSGTTTRYLYNIVRTLDKQYGTTYDAQYIPCDIYHLADSQGLPTSPLFSCYGGDTFIGKFGVVNQAAVAGGDDEIQFKVLSYFFCESTINVDYRHYTNPVGTEGQAGFIAGTTPYYPKLSVLYNDPKNTALTPGILNLSWTLGHGRGYNKQYSFENTILLGYPKAINEVTITNFSNRSIYSEQSIEGEQVDAYRIFLPNNYHDIPRDRGSITDTFVHENRFYIHTTGALYLTSFNDKEALITDKSSVYLGNGGVFSRPSEPIQTVNGGYAGTQGKWGLSTPFGYFFLDARQKKVFLLTNTLEDLSGQGLDTFFSTIEETDDFTLAFDYREGFNRLLISSSKGWTLSYQMKLKSWTGFHSYNPYYLISRGIDIYLIQSERETLLKLGVGEYGEYDNQYFPLKLSHIVNESASVNKKFDNVKVFSSTYQDELPKNLETFTGLQVINERRDTSPCELIVPQNYQDELQLLGINQIFAKFKNNEFRIAIPSDLLVNENVPGIYDSTRAFRPRITGKWAQFNWEFNRPHRKFVLHTLSVALRGVFR